MLIFELSTIKQTKMTSFMYKEKVAIMTTFIKRDL